ncbi:hypothetical protein Tco_0932755 [Tanacetum coccineum]
MLDLFSNNWYQSQVGPSGGMDGVPSVRPRFNGQRYEKGGIVAIVEGEAHGGLGLRGGLLGVQTQSHIGRLKGVQFHQVKSHLLGSSVLVQRWDLKDLKDIVGRSCRFYYKIDFDQGFEGLRLSSFARVLGFIKTTTGITTIPGERRSIEELEGMSWHLKPHEQTSVRVPSKVAVNERLNRSHDREVTRDDNLDEDEEHFIGICLQAPQEEHISYDEPSGKWDYYVKYDAPPDTTPIEEIAATGWGDEFSDDEVTPGKVTILEERSDWDDDERSGGKQELESEWKNLFAAKRAQIIKKHEEHAFPSTSQEESTQSYQPPRDSIMGPSVYPPAQQNPQPFYRPDYQFGYPQGKSKIFSGGYGEYYNSQWTLPPAFTSRPKLMVRSDIQMGVYYNQ